MSTPQYGFGTTVDLSVEQAIERVTAALKDEGFGVLTTIDVQQTMKQKLDIDFEPYVILGACNPQLAHQALESIHNIGLLLPCNVIVHAEGDRTRIEIADPIAMMRIVDNDKLYAVAREARSRLERVLQQLNRDA